MSEEMVIPSRLKKIASFLSIGTYFADIGSDHALLPIYICKHDTSARAIAGEINEGPYQSAMKNVKRYELEDMIDVRLGSGLNVVGNDIINEIVIAGMGGSLITSILEERKDVILSIERLVVQPNIQARKIRKWANENNMYVARETIIEENGHFYEIMVFEHGNANDRIDTLEEEKERLFMFGPLLLRDKTDVFMRKWSEERKKMMSVIDQMEHAQAVDETKVNRFKKELKWIEEVLS